MAYYSEMPQFLTNTSGQWLVGLVVTTCIAFITLILSWIKDRNAHARRSMIVDGAKKRVEFWAALIKDAEIFGVSPDTVETGKHEIRRAAKLVRSEFLHWPPPRIWQRDGYRKYLSGLGIVRRSLLIRQEPMPYMRRARIFWHTSLLFLFIMIVMSLARFHVLAEDPHRQTMNVYQLATMRSFNISLHRWKILMSCQITLFLTLVMVERFRHAWRLRRWLAKEFEAF